MLSHSITVCKTYAEVIDARSYFVANLSDRYEDTVAELRAVTEEKAEKEKQLKKAKEHEDLLQIPVEDVKMTEIKLGGGACGGNSK